MISADDLDQLQTLLADTDKEFRDRVLAALNADRVPPRRLVFALEPPGFVTLGYEGAEKVLPRPDQIGLYYAWQVFLFGTSAGAIIDAAALMELFGKDPGKWPGNALGNRLRDAADWVEREAKCPALASVIRSISVGKNGSIEFNPHRHPETRLGLL